MLDTGLVMAEGIAGGGLDTLKVVFEWLMSSMATVVTTVATTPLLLLPVGIFACGAIIGLTKRFIGR